MITTFYLINVIIFANYRILTLLIIISLNTANSSCQMPTGLEGVCVSYKKCKFVLDLYEKYNSQIPQNYLDYIFRSRCFSAEADTQVRQYLSYLFLLSFFHFSIYSVLYCYSFLTYFVFSYMFIVYNYISNDYIIFIDLLVLSSTSSYKRKCLRKH